MKFLIGFLLTSIVTVIHATCSLDQNTVVPPTQLVGRWYEQRSYGDGWMQFFFKCTKNDITLNPVNGQVSKARSYYLKLFPWITWTSTASLMNRGTTWQMVTKFGLFEWSQDISILAADEKILIMKACPNSWFTDESIWVSTSYNSGVTSEDTKKIAAVLEAAKEPSWTDFKEITQSGC